MFKIANRGLLTIENLLLIRAVSLKMYGGPLWVSMAIS
jgi:hypothetical protein